jgi:MoaA/NifB/PqqE/SkfB family radical SAM enzyme
MKNVINKLRLKWFITKNTLRYTSDYLDQIYKIYLNHNKVIHFRDGHPVYSLSTPALYSKPSANFFARQFYKSITNKNVPNLMSYAVTDVCNANCEHCSFFAGIEKIKKEVLTLSQAQKLIKDAQEIGVSVINFSGGEPLMREDLPEIIRSVDKDLSTTILFTNGWFLSEKIKGLKKAGLDSVFVSIDSASPEKHDKFRKTEGLFSKAIEGLKRSIKTGVSTGISCCMTPEAFKEGEFNKIVELGKNIGVHEILFYDAMPTGRYKDRTDLIGNSNWIEEMIKTAKKYNEDPDYPGILIYPYTTSYRSLGCSCGIAYLYVTPYGDICPCDFNHVVFGNILKTPLYQIWDKMTSMEDFKSVNWGECKLKDPKWQGKNTVSSNFSVYPE